MRILVKTIPEIGRLPSYIGIADAVLDYARIDAKYRIEKDGFKFVENWENAPDFETTAKIEGNDLVISCKPVGDADAVNHWRWVSRGTEARPIYPTGHPSSPNYVPPRYDAQGRWIGGGKTVLKYVHTYVPHTSGMGSHVKSGGPGQYTGSPVVATYEPNYPGIKPRHFEEAWRSRANLWFGRGIRGVINRAIERARG